MTTNIRHLNSKASTLWNCCSKLFRQHRDSDKGGSCLHWRNTIFIQQDRIVLVLKTPRNTMRKWWEKKKKIKFDDCISLLFTETVPFGKLYSHRNIKQMINEIHETTIIINISWFSGVIFFSLHFPTSSTTMSDYRKAVLSLFIHWKKKMA